MFNTRYIRKVIVGAVALAAASGVAFGGGPTSAAECTSAGVWYEVGGQGNDAVPYGCVVPMPDDWEEGCMSDDVGGGAGGNGGRAEYSTSCPQ
jgi:hypothetical protein